ncbi:MAG: hypothetical protein ACYTKD_28350 [Planctomycetota bacterium]|jgi:hypothetical protein
MKKPTPREVAFMVAELPGVAVIFLPFVWVIIPLLALLEAYAPGYCEWRYKAMAAVALLAFPILASTVRQALFGPFTKWEVRGAYTLALAALASNALLVRFFITGGGGSSEGAVILPSVLILAVGAAIVLAATRKGRVPPATHAHVAMLVAWMPNAAFCLLFFGQAGPWGTGFYVAIAAFVAYSVEATLRVRRALRSEGEAGAKGPPS